MAKSEFKYDVFISYSSADEDWVVNVLSPRLEKAGLVVCIDFRDFEPGKPSIINMQDALDNSRYTVLVMTPNWVSREWTVYEGILTRTDDPAGLQRRTIPLLLVKCDVPKFISMLTWVDFTRKDRESNAWKQLLNALGVTATRANRTSRGKTLMNNISEIEENELKFVVSEETQAKLRSIKGKGPSEAQEVLSTIRAALNLAEFDISQERVENIIDDYFDTENLSLYGYHASLRARRSQGKVTITAKTMKGMEQGQFSRTESSIQITESDYSELAGSSFKEFVSKTLPDIQGKDLLRTLRVNNERRAFHLRRNNENYELALDLFSFTNIRNNEPSDVQCEIEIEALNDEAKNKLGSIRRNLIEIVKDFDFSKDSKYEKGIKHLGLDKSSWLKWINENWNTSKGLAWIAILLTIIGIILSILLSR